MTVTKAIIPVAGLGTRFLPATKAQPKEMLPVIDKPVIQFLVEEAVASGITDIIFVTGRNKRAIEDHFDYAPELETKLHEKKQFTALKSVREISDMARFAYVRQKTPRGNGDAILAASHLIGKDEPVAVLFGDDIVDGPAPCLLQLVRVFERYNDSVVALNRIPSKEVHQYGAVKGTKIGERLYEIERIVEKPRRGEEPSNLIVAGKYVLTPDIFAELRRLRPSARGEIELTDALQNVIKKRPLYGFEFEGTRYDCGSKIGYLKATVDFGLRHPEVRKEFKGYLRGLRI